MERNLRSLVKEVQDYYRTITDVQALTTLQRQQYEADVRRTFESKGISYRLIYDEYSYVEQAQFTLPDVDVIDVGTIEDVSETGQYPISLRVDDNIGVHYEPRNLTMLTNDVAEGLCNSEFLHLAKGGDYRFHGRLRDCTYYIRREHGDPKYPQFVFTVVGNDESSVVHNIDKDNSKRAITSGVLTGLLGAGAGFAVALVICVILSLIILPLYSWSKYGLGSPEDHSRWPILLILAGTIIGAVVGYHAGYSGTRREVLRQG